MTIASERYPAGARGFWLGMAAYLVLVGFFFVVINLIVDLLYHVLDPRLRVDRERVGVG